MCPGQETMTKYESHGRLGDASRNKRKMREKRHLGQITDKV